MSEEWKASEVPFRNAAAFGDLPSEVQERVREARRWEKVDGGWQAINFVDEPHGNFWSVRRSTDELGTEEIEVVEIRYVERRFPVARQESEG